MRSSPGMLELVAGGLLAMCVVPGSGHGETSCFDAAPAVRTLEGPQSRFDTRRDRLAPGTAIDARRAVWDAAHKFPVVLGSEAPLCFSGGIVQGGWNQETTTWKAYSGTSAFYLFADGAVIEDVRVHNYGDGVSQREPTGSWTLRRSWFTDIHDDCIENDDHGNALIEDNLLDGCYVAISTRNSDLSMDGRENLMEIRGNLIRLASFARNHRETQGHRGVFKFDKDGRGPRVAMHDNVILAEQNVKSGVTLFPALHTLDSCSNNLLLWVGSRNDFEEALTDSVGPDGLDDGGRLRELAHCFQVLVADPRPGQTQEEARRELLERHWQPRVERWKATHPAGRAEISSPAAAP